MIFQCTIIGNDQGQYLFLSSSFTNQKDVIAVLQSETFPAASHAGRCLTFWYIIRGTQLGRVEISITNSKATTLIWALGTTDQGDTWQFASVGFYSDEEYSVRRRKKQTKIQYF